MENGEDFLGKVSLAGFRDALGAIDNACEVKRYEAFYAGFPVNKPIAIDGDLPRPTNSNVEDARVWTMVRASGNPEELRGYLTRFPNGAFAKEAEAMLRATQ